MSVKTAMLLDNPLLIIDLLASHEKMKACLQSTSPSKIKLSRMFSRICPRYFQKRRTFREE